MALIEKAKGRGDGGYTRLMGNEAIGLLLSKAQAAVITSGTELEKEIIARSRQIEDLDAFVASGGGLASGVYLASKKTVKKSLLATDQEPDLLVFSVDERKKHCCIIELKDGDAFDTKKSQGEKNSLSHFQNHISRKLPFTTSIHICCFNAASRQEVVKGLKNKISLEEAMIGKELCDLLAISYADIVNKRRKDQQDNFRYFLERLFTLPEAAALLAELESRQTDAAASEAADGGLFAGI